jgi:hypothetical protein
MSRALIVCALLLLTGSARAQAPAADADPTPAPAPEAPDVAIPGPPPGVEPGDAALPALDPGDPLPADLGASGLDGEDGPRLDFYGFADVNFWQPLMSRSNPWTQLFPEYSSFAVGNLNLYIDGHLAPNWRSLIEVRFLYSPHGEQRVRPDGRFEIVDNTLVDPAEFGRRIVWGGVLIERAWIEYRAHDRLTLRVGQFLTPYGIWNVDHGSPVLIGIRRPYIIREGLFPERQTGLELYGDTHLGALRFGYHLTLSNGRGPADSLQDYDANKALGGRLWLSRRGATEGTLGLSGFAGRTTSPTYRAVPLGGSFGRELVSMDQRDTWSLAADLRLRHGGLLVQSEAAFQRIRFTAEGRPVPPLSLGRFLPDNDRKGVYVLTGYRFDWMGLMPYVLGEYFRTGSPGPATDLVGHIPTVVVGYVGVNVRPWPNIVLKAEVVRGMFPGSGPGSWGRSPMTSLQTQLAWAF